MANFQALRHNSDLYIEPAQRYAPVIRVYFTTPKNKKPVFFAFGALHLMETMCHIAQQTFDPSICHQDLPYLAAVKVAQYICPVIGDNSHFVFALCEACLMGFQPGDIFFEMLTLMQQCRFVPQTELEIYDFVLNNVHGPDNTTLIDIYQAQAAIAIEQLRGYFTIDFFDNERVWVTHVFNQAVAWRLANPAAMLSLIKTDSLYSESLRNIIRRLGTPLLRNNKNAFWFHSPEGIAGREVRLDRFASINEIYHLWIHAERPCGLYGYCGQQNLTDGRCLTRPWSRSNDAQLCGYAQFWKVWGLIGKEPTLNE